MKVHLQLLGWKSTSGVYQLSFHSVHPAFQIHIPVDDHRRPYVETEAPRAWKLQKRFECDELLNICE